MNDTSDFVENVRRLDTQRRERELLDPAQTYMRNAHLLPPREEFSSVDWYVRVLQLFARAPARVEFYRFLPTLAQRRCNAARLMEWEATQRRGRDTGEKHRRAMGLVHAWCFVRRSRGRPPVAGLQPGNRDGDTKDALRYLAPLVNDGSISRDELAEAIIEASHGNRHIPDNKSRAQVEADIDRAITKFGEPFDWDRLDDDCC